jgi:uncharacterized NAD(P)/FAD-binding protein YdhS
MKKIEIAIIGGGASGVIAAIRLLETLGERAHITIFESKKSLAEGRAYSTQEPTHLLNVPVEKMDYSIHHPLDFKSWLEKNHYSVFQTKYYPFVPRNLYAQYLRERLKEVEKKVGLSIRWLKKRVNKIKETAQGWKLSDLEGSTWEFSFCLCASGYQEDFGREALKLSKKFESNLLNAYDSDRIREISPNENVLLIGAGLSAVDVWRQLKDQGHKAHITFFSRHGLFPLSHGEAGAAIKLEDLKGKSVSDIYLYLKKVKAQLKLTWATVADSLRPQISTLWTSFSESQKMQFLNRYKPYWEIIRHRLPAPVHAELSDDLNSKNISILKGRIIETRTRGDEIELIYKYQSQTFSLKTHHLVIATGAKIEQSELSFELINGKINSCPYRFGYQHKGTKNIWFIGPAAKTMKWEITAIPDIRVQIEGIVGDIDKLLL